MLARSPEQDEVEERWRETYAAALVTILHSLATASKLICYCQAQFYRGRATVLTLPWSLQRMQLMRNLN